MGRQGCSLLGGHTPFPWGTSLPLLSTPVRHPAAEPAAYMTHTCAKSEQIWVVTTQSRQAGDPRQAAAGAGRCRRGRSALRSAGFTSPNSHARGARRGAHGTLASACGPASLCEGTGSQTAAGWRGSPTPLRSWSLLPSRESDLRGGGRECGLLQIPPSPGLVACLTSSARNTDSRKAGGPRSLEGFRAPAPAVCNCPPSPALVSK